MQADEKGRERKTREDKGKSEGKTEGRESGKKAPENRISF
jgi:hypothetical protein